MATNLTAAQQLNISLEHLRVLHNNLNEDPNFSSQRTVDSVAKRLADAIDALIKAVQSDASIKNNITRYKDIYGMRQK